MNRIRLALFPDRVEAAPIRDSLIKAGIPAEIHCERQMQRLWFVSKSAAGAPLEVPLHRWEEATKLLIEWDAVTGALQRAIRCPECGSLRVDYPQFTRKSFLTNLAMGLMAELRFVERQYYCEECHCMWSKRRTKPVRPGRAHQAPNYFIENVGEDRLAAERGREGQSEPRR